MLPLLPSANHNGRTVSHFRHELTTVFPPTTAVGKSPASSELDHRNRGLFSLSLTKRSGVIFRCEALVQRKLVGEPPWQCAQLG